MRVGLRRRARRWLLAAAASCLLLAFVAPASSAQQEDEVSRPEVFRAAASSQVASIEVDRGALVPIPELFRFIVLDGSGIYQTSTRQARASLFFPGNGLILGPNLLCGTFGGQFPPEFKPILDTCLQYEYPLTVFADDLRPDGSTSGGLQLGSPGDPISGNAVRAAAHAGEDAAVTDAAIQDLRVIGLPAFGPVALPIPIPGFELDTSVLTIDSATSRTDERIVPGGSLVSDATATMSGVRMIGGLLNIGSLRSQSRVTDDAVGGRTAVANLEVSGVTVAGVPAQITDQGLVVAEPSPAGGPLAQQASDAANALVQALGVEVTVLGFEKNPDDDGTAIASVGGLLVEFARDVQGLPTVPGPLGEVDPNGLYVGSIQLGATGVLGSAINFPDEPFDSLPDSGEFAFDPEATFGGSEIGVDLPTPSGEVAEPSGDASAPSTELRTRSLVDLFGDRIGLVLLALMFMVLALAIAPRFTLPARLPGPSS